MPLLQYIRSKIYDLFSDSNQRYQDIDPDEIFLDSHNRPEFNRDQFEGRLEKPISKTAVYLLGAVCMVLVLSYVGRLWVLQVERGEAYRIESNYNSLDHEVVFAQRGVIVDRNEKELVWNTPSDDADFPHRKYVEMSGLSHVLGYVKPPQKDASGNFYQTTFLGKDGVEEAFDTYLSGENGIRIVEENALNERISESGIQQPQNGETLRLTIDAELQEKLFSILKETAQEHGYSGGAGVFMDIQNGDIIALTSYPEYPSQDLTDGTNAERIRDLFSDSATPFLNRATEGLYTPGSIIKPFVAVAALNEGVVTPNTKIESTGQIRVQNPYFPDRYTIFRDWKAHGMVDVTEAIAVSSNIFFYEIGGGYQDQEGLGIYNIRNYMDAFDIGEETGVVGLSENSGVIPGPEWKKQNFNGEPWRLGDTYNTSIGQYGFQVTPIQIVRGVGALATNGTLVTPRVADTVPVSKQDVSISIDDSSYELVKEGMRKAVTEGTAKGLDVPYLKVAAKTGTAEVSGKRMINSWLIGFFPYESPRYAFSIVMDHGPSKNTIGGVYVMRSLLDWMHSTSSPYIQGD